MKRLIALLVAGIGLTFLAAQAPPAQAKKEKERENLPGDSSKLVGTYKITGGEKDGKAIPEEHLKGSIVVFNKDNVLGTDKDRKEFFAAKYNLDGTAKPMKITLVTTAPKDGGTAVGIIEISGDTVRLCYPLPGGETPTEFKTKDKQHMFVLKQTDK